MVAYRDPVLEVDVEDAFATEPGDFASAALLTRMMDLSGEHMDYAGIEDESFTFDHGGFKRIKGLPEGNPSFDTYAVGLGGSGAGDGVAATANAVTTLLSTVGGTAVVLATGDTVAAAPAPTISEYAEVTGARFGAGQIVVTDVAGSLEARPVITYVDPLMTLGMKHSAIPAAAQVIYAAANLKWTDNPATHPTAVCKCVGNNTSQHVTWLGCVADLSIPGTRPNEPQKLSWTLTAANFADLTTDTKVEPAAPTVPVTNSNGYFLLGLEGIEQDYMKIGYGSVEIDMGLEYSPVDDPHSDDVGIQAWQRQKANPITTLWLPIDKDPSAAATASGSGGLATTEDTFREILRTGTDNAFQLLCQFGKTAGGIFVVWQRSLHLVDWEMDSLGDIPAQKLTFAWKQGGKYGASSTWAATVPRMIIAQA